jgi:hypothetical protein
MSDSETMRRIAPAFALYFLSPFVAEFLLGDFSIKDLVLILPLSPLYGGGALLIREVVRRTGRGWPTIVLLAMAFGVFEEGLLTQSLFNKAYGPGNLLDPGYVPALGIAIPWTIFVISIHTIWSISTPIALVEESTRTRRTTPWLRIPGLAVAIGLFIAGAGSTFAFSYGDGHFLAHPAQLIVAALVVVALVVAAFLLPRRSAAVAGSAPSPWLVFGTAMVAGILVFGTALMPTWVGVAVALVVIVALVLLILRWSAQEGWGSWHRFALPVAAMLTYAWHSFFQEPVQNSEPTLNLVTHIVFTLVALVIIWYAHRRVGHEESEPVTPVPTVQQA